MTEKIYWADLHNHNEVGYGKGSLERSYLLAENFLDVYAFVPHGWWPDIPQDDPKVRDRHLNAFDRVADSFPTVCAKANAALSPERFVSLVGYEWHSSQWGDYHVLFPGSEGTLCRAADVHELQEFARAQNALLIPHHCAYRVGWRGTNWECWQADVSPVAEAHSEHGNSLEFESAFPMIGHSMGGSLPSQTIMTQLQRRRVLGLTAGTDNHYGHPACYGEGITGILAEDLTRDGVMAALRARHTFAATGDRIELRVHSGDALMGDVLPESSPRTLEIDIAPLGPMEFVQVLKNGDPAANLLPSAGVTDAATGDRYLVRVEWGWGLLGSSSLTSWKLHIAVEGGAIARVVPCFAGGEGSTELLNRTHTRPGEAVEIESFTSRLNARPTNSAVLDIAGDSRTRLRLTVESVTDGELGGCEISSTLGCLAKDSVTEPVLRRFSAPKVRVGRPYSRRALQFQHTWRDKGATAPGDFYMVKAQQRNGQCAWSSPIWFGETT